MEGVLLWVEGEEDNMSWLQRPKLWLYLRVFDILWKLGSVPWRGLDSIGN